MLKKPIKEGRVYLDGNGVKRGPMRLIEDMDYPWRCQKTGLSYTDIGELYNGGSSEYDLVSRVKTPKAEKNNSQWTDDEIAAIKADGAKPLEINKIGKSIRSDKPKKPKWREAWAVSGALHDDLEIAKQVSEKYQFQLFRARVRIKPEE